MNHEFKADVIESMMNPETYDEDVKEIEMVQTHISYVFLTGKYVYKIKKPVNFGFADFSTLDKRKFFCEKELELNRRLCGDMYVAVVPINQSKGQIKIKGAGEVVEYALKMRQIPQESIMSNLLKENKINEKIIGKIAEIVANFHSKAETNEEISKYGRIKNISYIWNENFDQTVEFIGKTIDKGKFDFIKEKVNNFIKNDKKLFEKRISEGKIRDCHGDLHSGNIFIADKIYIFDCLEFNDRYRYSDIILDIAFFAMDLEFNGREDLSKYFVEKYVEFSGEKEMFKLLKFYECWRAYVRGKVISLKLNDPQINEKEKKEAERMAIKYFDLGYKYAAELTES